MKFTLYDTVNNEKILTLWLEEWTLGEIQTYIRRFITPGVEFITEGELMEEYSHKQCWLRELSEWIKSLK